jgi:IclR family transcriptional regulator, KDG regulon repressor
MNELQQKTSATVLLGALMDDQLVYLDKRDGDGVVRIASEVGWRRAPHHGMLGMILMAALPADRQSELMSVYPLAPVTALTITDPTAFRLRLSEIAREGYVIERGEAVEGVVGVAAPIRDHSNNVIAAIGAAIVEAQHDQNSISTAVIEVQYAARGISEELGCMRSREG